MTEAVLQEVLQMVCAEDSCPIVRFELTSSRNEEILSVALDRVLIDRVDDTMERVKQRAEALTLLEQNGYLLVSYGAVMEQEDAYDISRESALYEYFQGVVAEARSRADFAFDTGRMQRGVVLLTEKGKQARTAGRFSLAHSHHEHHSDCGCGHEHHEHHSDCGCGHEHHEHHSGRQ